MFNFSFFFFFNKYIIFVTIIFFLIFQYSFEVFSFSEIRVFILKCLLTAFFIFFICFVISLRLILSDYEYSCLLI